MGRKARGEVRQSELVLAVAAAQGVRELRQAQAVLLPLLGLSLAETASAIGMSISWVAQQRTAILHGHPIREARNQGGRRNSLFKDLVDEKRIAALIASARGGEITDATVSVVPLNAEALALDAFVAEMVGGEPSLSGASPVKLTVDTLREALMSHRGRSVSRSAAHAFGVRNGLIEKRSRK